MRILVFGDSIVYGAWDAEGGWVERLKKWAHQKTVKSNGETKVQVLNLGIGGDSSTKILARIESEIVARYSGSWPFIFVFTFGTNDERSIDGKVETTIEQYEANIHKIIDCAKQHTDKIIFLGIPPLGHPTVVFKGQEYSDERIKQYEDVLRKIVQENNLLFIEVREVFETRKANGLYAYDNLHPNDEGHQLIADLVRPELEKLL